MYVEITGKREENKICIFASSSCASARSGSLLLILSPLNFHTEEETHTFPCSFYIMLFIIHIPHLHTHTNKITIFTPSVHLLALVKDESLLSNFHLFQSQTSVEVRIKDHAVSTYGESCIVSTHCKHHEVSTHCKHPLNTPISHLVSTRCKHLL
jgi:hypothetical protein